MHFNLEDKSFVRARIQTHNLPACIFLSLRDLCLPDELIASPNLWQLTVDDFGH